MIAFALNMNFMTGDNQKNQVSVSFLSLVLFRLVVKTILNEFLLSVHFNEMINGYFLNERGAYISISCHLL